LDRKDIFSNRNNQTNTRTGEKFNKKGDKECAGKHSGVKATSNVQSVKIMPHVGSIKIIHAGGKPGKNISGIQVRGSFLLRPNGLQKSNCNHL